MNFGLDSSVSVFELRTVMKLMFFKTTKYFLNKCVPVSFLKIMLH